jgi:hypothetical protein
MCSELAHLFPLLFWVDIFGNKFFLSLVFLLVIREKQRRKYRSMQKFLLSNSFTATQPNLPDKKPSFLFQNKFIILEILLNSIHMPPCIFILFFDIKEISS